MLTSLMAFGASRNITCRWEALQGILDLINDPVFGPDFERCLLELIDKVIRTFLFSGVIQAKCVRQEKRHD